MVPRRGLEPPRPCERQHLKLVRLPIPPPGHMQACWQAAALRKRRPALSMLGAAGLSRHAHDRTRRNSLSPSSAAADSSAATSANICSGAESGCASRSRDPRNAYFLQPLAPGRPVRLREGGHHQPGQRPQRGEERDGGGEPVRRVRHGDARRPCRRRAQCRRGGARRRRAARWSRSRRSAPSLNPQSAYGRTKGEGEAAVREAFPEATIIRPSLVFGPEDDLTNRFAAMARLPFLPVDRRQAQFPAGLCPRPRQGDRDGRARSRPLRRQDVRDRRAAGDEHGRAPPRDPRDHRQDPEIVHMPDFFASLIAKLGWLPGAPLTRDQWLMLQRDNVPAAGAAGPRGVRDRADAARRRRLRMARPLPSRRQVRRPPNQFDRDLLTG